MKLLNSNQKNKGKGRNQLGKIIGYLAKPKTPPMTLAQRIENSKTSLFKAVFPNTTNHYDTLFGGTAMQLMDEVAFITATRFTRKKVVTISSDKINFTSPIPAGTIIELIGEVSRIGNTSLDIKVNIYIEQMYSQERENAISGSFTFVAIDDTKKPTNILDKQN